MNERNGLRGTHGFWKPIYISPSYRTISVGIFEWVPRSAPKGTKRGKTKVRVRGWASDEEAIYTKAHEIVALLDKGVWTGPKLVDLTKSRAAGGEDVERG